jgi:hypothetical protein
VAYAKEGYRVARDFYPGTLNSGTWIGPPFVWETILGEGTYHIQVTVKNFQSGESAATSAVFVLSPLSTGGKFVVSATPNPLVAIASAPPCAAGSNIRLTIQKIGGNLSSKSSFSACTPNHTTNIYAAGMLSSTSYSINYQIATDSAITSGPQPVTFTTGPLPSTIAFPSFSVVIPAGSQIDETDQTVLHAFLSVSTTFFLPVATDRNGDILWYYYASDATQSDLLTRPLSGGNMLTLQTGNPWGSTVPAEGQYLREIDLGGNIVRETNIGVLQQQLLAKGAIDFGPCNAISLPAAIGAACMGGLHHDAIRLPNGDTAVINDIEKIFPPGTQGDTTGLNVDIIGDGIIVLDKNFQVLWYFDTFQHDSGAPQLDINRPAVLGETCGLGQSGCPSLFLVGTTGVAPLANDWLHQNCLYYDPVNGDIIFSSRHQDWVMKVDYQNGTGTGNILWRLGLDGDFTFNNTNNDPYPWFSHQHDAGFEDPATGLMSLFDNGNTRVAPPPLGLGSGNSRGMALSLDITNMTVTPVMSQDLGYFAFALGSAQLLGNGNYLFQPGIVAPDSSDYSIEVLPTAGTVNGTAIYNLESPGFASYRSWLMPNLYFPPTT